jgi:hypothetical protein
MIKTLFAAAALTFAFAGAASADEMKKCDEATMKMVMEMVEKAEGDAKTMAMKEFDMAKTAMEAKDEAKCSEQLGMAEKAAMGK